MGCFPRFDALQAQYTFRTAVLKVLRKSPGLSHLSGPQSIEVHTNITKTRVFTGFCMLTQPLSEVPALLYHLSRNLLKRYFFEKIEQRGYTALG